MHSPDPAAPHHLPFTSLGLSPEVLKAVAQLGFEEASPIQTLAIPVLLGGADVVGQSQTGSGKTAAFAIPAIERVDASKRAVQVLILAPTRELATQVADEVHKLAAFKRGLVSVPIYGGASYERQFSELKRGAQVVVGTPGRIMDHLRRGTLDLSQLKMAVLDEADRMLDMGFRDDIQEILSAAPGERQTVFFSATLSPEIKALIQRHSRTPKFLAVAQKTLSAPKVEQTYFEVRRHAKFEALLRLLDFHAFKSGVIFCNTQRTVDELADALSAQGFAADRLHGGIAQAQRTRVMDKFKQGGFAFLVATDVAARGIDVDGLAMVLNFDLPYDAEDYVHRIGRTGRAGREGQALTFVTGAEIYKLQFIERYTKSRIRRGTIPSDEAIGGKRTDALFERVRALLEAGDVPPHTAFLDRLLEQGHGVTDIASVLIHLLMGTAPPAAEVPPAPARPAPPAAEAEPVKAAAPAEAPAPTPAPPSVKRQAETLPAAKPAPVAKPKPPAAPMAADAEATALPRATTGKQWIWLDIGRSAGLNPAQLVDVIVGQSGAPRRTVGVIQFEDSGAFVEIQREVLDDTVARLLSSEFQGRPIQAQPVFAKGAHKKKTAKPGSFRKSRGS